MARDIGLTCYRGLVVRRALLAASGACAILLACGSRGPLDDGPSATSLADAGDASATADVVIPLEASPGATDAGRDAGPIACAGCVIGTCGQAIVDCIGTPACLSVFTCITTTCLAPRADGGGGPGGGGLGGLDATCLLGCAGKNPAGALQVIQIFQCVTGTCSPDCGGLLGGLGGLGGIGGGTKIAEGPFERDAFEEAFSPWPELMSR